MAIKQVVVSDLSGQPVPDEEHARIVVTHPDYRQALELDVAVSETSKLADNTLRLIEFMIYAPNEPPRKAVMESKVVDKLFPNLDEVLQGARKANTDAPAQRRSRGSGASAAPKGDRIDYTAMENIGLIHRGKVTEEEARLVRENMAQANKNREREGQPKIGDDPKDSQRYGLS